MKQILKNVFFFISIVFSTILYPMIFSSLRYPALKQMSTPQIKQYRDGLCYQLTDDDVDFDAIIECGKDWTCHQYSLSQKLGYGMPLSSLDGKLTLNQYFEQKSKPENGNLALYIKDENTQEPLHSGIVVGNGAKIASKWGDKPYIFTHKAFNVPDAYGDNIIFLELKPEFNNPGGKEKIACELYELHTKAIASNRTTHLGAEKPHLYNAYIVQKYAKNVAKTKPLDHSICLQFPATNDKPQQRWSNEVAIYTKLRDSR